MTHLKRDLGPWLLTFYGLGNILGAGIYVLVGKVAEAAGYYAPLSFILAALIAAFTALTYAELLARFPVAAGEAVYLQEGFGLTWLSVLTGLLIAVAGILSAATITRGFAGYAQVLVQLPDWMLISAVLSALGALACWGIGQSVKAAALITIAELIGLILIIMVGASALGDLPAVFENTPSVDYLSIWPGIFKGAFLAFYAFIGFEDMVNVAEEVEHPERNMPRAIFAVLFIATVLYGLVALVAIANLSPEKLAASKAPLADIYQMATGQTPLLISLIGLFAVINGALIQIIMASRIFYGMSRRGWLPAVLGSINKSTHTPIIATLMVTGAISGLAIWLPLVSLAKSTSYLILVVFVLVNLALLRIRRQPAPDGVLVFPAWVPLVGALGAGFLFFAQILSS